MIGPYGGDWPTAEQLRGDEAEWLYRQQVFMERQLYRRAHNQKPLDDPEGFEDDWNRRHPTGDWTPEEGK